MFTKVSKSCSCCTFVTLSILVAKIYWHTHDNECLVFPKGMLLVAFCFSLLWYFVVFFFFLLFVFLMLWLILLLSNSISFVPAFAITFNNSFSIISDTIHQFHTRKHYFATVLRKENDKKNQLLYRRMHGTSLEMPLRPCMASSQVVFCLLWCQSVPLCGSKSWQPFRRVGSLVMLYY